jgi:hypothetical protein
MDCYKCCGGCKVSFDKFDAGLLITLWNTDEWIESEQIMKNVWDDIDISENEKKRLDCYYRKKMYWLAVRLWDLSFDSD